MPCVFLVLTGSKYFFFLFIGLNYELYTPWKKVLVFGVSTGSLRKGAAWVAFGQDLF